MKKDNKLGSLVDKLIAKYPELQKEPMMDEMLATGGAILNSLPEGGEYEINLHQEGEDEEDESDMGAEMPEDEEDMSHMAMSMDDMEPGDEDMLEDYEDKDMEMLANSNEMQDEDEKKKKEHKRRMALRAMLSGKA